MIRPFNKSTIPPWLAEHPDLRLADDPLQYLSEHSKSFRFATSWLPDAEARRIADVYAWCRFTDDMVDKAKDVPPDALLRRLDDWQTLSLAAYEGETSGIGFLDRSMSDSAAHAIPFSYPAELIDGMRMDLTTSTYRDMQELRTYTYRVAGVVGLWLCRLNGANHSWALKRAEALGHAMQLTNILRDVGEDLERGRLYLPLDRMTAYGLKPEDIDALRRRMPDEGRRRRNAYAALMEELIVAAESDYELALSGLGCLPTYFRRPVAVSALVYRDIHSALRNNRYDNFRLRAHTSSARKVLLGISAFVLTLRSKPMRPESGGEVKTSLSLAPGSAPEVG